MKSWMEEFQLHSLGTEYENSDYQVCVRDDGVTNQWLSMPESGYLKAVQWTKYKTIKKFRLKC